MTGRGNFKYSCAGWIFLFLVLNTAFTHGNYDNTLARYATMASLSEDNSYQIDKYVGPTSDWGRTPDGHYYSNKPPGPMLLGFPLFWVLDKWLTYPATDRAERDRIRQKSRDEVLRLLSLLFQVIPFAFLTWLTLGHLKKLGVSARAAQITALALLFGNTSAVFMNSYFGHGMAALGILGATLALLKKRPVLIGLGFGLALLCDFGTALLALPLFAAAWLSGEAKGPKTLGWIVLGGVLPGLLWCQYHITCFGSPFIVADKFVNPIFINKNHGDNLWGILALPPNYDVLGKLLFGNVSGILWTQPWLLFLCLVLPAVMVKANREKWATEPEIKSLTLFAVPGLCFLLLMNASFGGWHNGGTPGPRYLCSVFPAFAVLLGLCYDRLKPAFQMTAWALLFTSLVYFILVISTTLYTNTFPLWPFYFKFALVTPTGRTIARLVITTLGFLTALYWELRPSAPAARGEQSPHAAE